MRHASSTSSQLLAPTGAPTLDLCQVVFAATLLLVLVTLEPFTDRSTIATISSPTLDIAYPAIELGLVGFGFLLSSSALRVALPSLVRTFSVLLFIWLIVSVVTSQNFDLSLRRFVVMSVDVTLATIVLMIPKGLEDFSRVFIFCVACVLVLCYLGVLVVPSLSIHQLNDAMEPELAGSWRGLYFHKNAAGMMMAVYVFVGLFVWRQGRPIPGVLITIAAMVFLVMTRSKNAVGLVVLVSVLAVLIEHSRSLWARAALCIGPLIVLNFLTIGTVFFQSAKHIDELFGIDPTFTGRSEIWSFVADRIAERPITGYGLLAFWNTAAAYAAGEFERGWVWRAGASHNAFFDLALMIGIPGTILMIVVVAIYPLIDYHRHLPDASNSLLASLFLRIWLFLLYTAALESLFLERGPTWFMLMLAIFGLRYVSVMRVAP
jgi:O-antigen ligase